MVVVLLLPPCVCWCGEEICEIKPFSCCPSGVAPVCPCVSFNPPSSFSHNLRLPQSAAAATPRHSAADRLICEWRSFMRLLLLLLWSQKPLPLAWSDRLSRDTYKSPSKGKEGKKTGVCACVCLCVEENPPRKGGNGISGKRNKATTTKSVRLCAKHLKHDSAYDEEATVEKWGRERERARTYDMIQWTSASPFPHRFRWVLYLARFNAGSVYFMMAMHWPVVAAGLLFWHAEDDSSRECAGMCMMFWGHKESVHNLNVYRSRWAVFYDTFCVYRVFPGVLIVVGHFLDSFLLEVNFIWWKLESMAPWLWFLDRLLRFLLDLSNKDAIASNSCYIKLHFM